MDIQTPYYAFKFKPHILKSSPLQNTDINEIRPVFLRTRLLQEQPQPVQLNGCWRVWHLDTGRIYIYIYQHFAYVAAFYMHNQHSLYKPVIPYIINCATIPAVKNEITKLPNHITSDSFHVLSLNITITAAI